MLMQIDELHKFNDGTLTDVCTDLDDHLKGIRMKYLPQTIWRKSDKERAAAMIQAIDKQPQTIRIIRSLERSILTDLQVTPTKPRRMTKPYSSHCFIANCFNAGNLKMEVKVVHRRFSLVQRSMLILVFITSKSPVYHESSVAIVVSANVVDRSIGTHNPRLLFRTLWFLDNHVTYLTFEELPRGGWVELHPIYRKPGTS
nr:hypothetical protein [Tanacetum cinerariifolium]